MNPLLDILRVVHWLAGEKEAEEGGDTVVLIVLGLVVLFFLWLVIAAVRKKLSSAKGRMGEYTEEEAEAARAARLWAEARRRTEEEEEEEEDEDEEPAVDLQSELLERAQERRETKLETDPSERVLPYSIEPAEETTTVPDTTAETAAAPTAEPELEPELEREPEPEPAVAAATPKPAEPEAPPRTLEDGLKKTRDGFVSRLTRVFGRSTVADDEVEEIEEILFTADIGVRASQRLIDFIQKELDRKSKADPDKLLEALKGKIESMLQVEASPMDVDAHTPFVVLVVGVNGTGKTTTIGKLAMKYKKAGKKVLLAAGDTFRAAAREQLQIWGQRAGAQVIHGQDGADPGAVVYDAISAARSQGADVVIADTAGRLHTKVNLVEELKKVHRVCGKAMEGAPHEVLLVLDATTGQNAINQAKQFHKALTVTGITLTKLDGTAKGGVIIGICDTFGIPVRFIGIGEQVDDLRPFEPSPFVRAMFS